MVSHITAKLLATNDTKNPKNIQGQEGTMVSMIADFSSETMMKVLKGKNQISEKFYIQQKYPLKIKSEIDIFQINRSWENLSSAGLLKDVKEKKKKMLKKVLHAEGKWYQTETLDLRERIKNA